MSCGPRPRVAVVAFTAEPDRGSEYEVGWRWPFLVAERYRIWVLTRRASWDNVPGRARTFRGMALKRHDGVMFAAIDIPGAVELFTGRRLMRTHYLIWQVLVLAWLRQRRKAFAFLHHLTFVAAWFPPFAAFAGPPLIWGPIGTNPPLPDFYRATLGTRGRLSADVRAFVTRTLVRWNPLVHLVAPRVTGGFAISDYVRGLLPPNLQARIAVQAAIGVDDDWFGGHDVDRPERLLFVGRAMEVKMPRLALDVARDVIARRPGASAVFIGEGLPGMLGDVGRGIEVRPHTSQDALRSLYRDSSVFLFPSCEVSGFVTLEAMANGLPVACLRDTGAARFSGEESGLVVDTFGGYAAARQALADAVVAVLGDRERLRGLRPVMQARARTFGWDTYRGFINDLFDRTAAGAATGAIAPGWSRR